MDENKNELKEMMTTSFLIVASVVIYAVFPTENFFQQVAVLVTFFVLLPLFFKKGILKKNKGSFKLGIGNWREGLLWSSGTFMVSLLVFYAIANYTPFLSKYGVPREIAENFTYFVGYELLFVLTLSFVYQFFFSGFILSSYQKAWGYGAVFASWSVFFAIVFLSGTSFWTTLPYLIFTPLAGVIALKSGSIWYSVAAQFLFVVIVDISFIKTIF